MSDQTGPKLLGYTLTEELYSGNRSAVYQAIEEKSGKSVVIKFLRSHDLSINEFVCFLNQYSISKNLDIPDIVKPLALVPLDHSYALVMEDVKGISLKDYVQAHGRLSVEQVMAIGLQLANTLHHLNQYRVLHKDINPANILIHPFTQQLWLTDFGLASLLPKEIQELQSPAALNGNLAYMAPEQTGRMNRGIDYRVDFYSVGITLYELLTGEHPFQSDDLMELIYCHIAKAPLPPCDFLSGPNSPIPKPLSDIVLKLMAKNAEGRYQSALGLKHDLQQCLQQWQASGQIEAFELGQEDRCEHFLIPEKLYGREREVQALFDAFERVAQGASELILVTGFPGVGKTAVVNEVHKPITRKKGYFIKGKFDQFNLNIPFSAFVQAFRRLMGQILSESDVDLGAWKTKILAAVGEQGQVLIAVIPELALIIGPQVEVAELSGIAAQNRFNQLFRVFIQVFTSPDHPLVIFLDDLQWADSASLDLLKGLITGAETGCLLLLGAYRDNEVSPAHPLMLMLDEIGQTFTTTDTLTLEPLTQNDIQQLTAMSLRCSVEMATPLAQLVYQKTQGNPFFATQFLQGMQTDGWITFNAEVGYWQCDLSQIRPLAVTDDVVEFMVKRLKQWPQTTQNALSIAACLGSQFDLNILAMVCEKSPSELAHSLLSALQAGLIIPENESYKVFQGTDDQPTTTQLSSHDVNVTYRFLHDQVQQAAYAFIPESNKPKTHYQIGQFLLEHIPQGQQEEYLFEIVNQLNIGRDLITHTDEHHQLISLNFRAGMKAKSATAYGTALVYFEIAIDNLPEDSWQQNYSLALKLHENAAEAAYLVGNGARMESLVQTVTTQAKTCLDTVKTLHSKMQFCVGQNEPLASLKIGRKLLQELGIILPNSPTLEDVKQELETCQQFAKQFSFDEIVALPRLTDPEKLAIISTSVLMVSPSMITAPNLFFLISLITTKFSLENGNSPYAPFGYAAYAILLKGVAQDLDAAYAWGQLAVRLLKTSNSMLLGNRVYQSNSVFITHGKRHVEETLNIFQKAYSSGLENGDFEFAAYSILIKCHNLYFLGRELSDVKQTIIQTNEVLSYLGQNLPFSWNQCFYQTVIKLSGTDDESHLLTEDVFNPDTYVQSKQEQRDIFGLCYFYINQAHLLYILGHYSQALKASDSVEQYLAGQVGMLTEVVFYFYDSLIRLACAQGPEDAKVLAKVSENQQKMKLWADHAPMNFRHKYELVCAEEQRLLGDRLAAMDYYDLAIAGAQTNGYLQEQAIANERAARFYLDWGKEKIAAIYMQEAYLCYDRWGAKTKIDDLATCYATLLQPILQQTSAIDPLETLHSIAPVNLSDHSSDNCVQCAIGALNASLDLATIFKSAQALSECIDLSELLEKLAPLMLQTSGAERLALLMPDPDTTWHVNLIATAETIELVSDRLGDHSPLPVQLIQYVQRTKEILIVDGLDPEVPIVDHYLQQHPHRSVLCAPLLHQSQLIGLLYLEHHLVADVFDRDRITILNFLCTQAAISLENAQLNQALTKQLEVQTAKRRESETRLQKMVDNIPGVVYQLSISVNGEVDSISYISPDCYDLYEVTAEAFIGGQYDLRDFEHKDDRPILDQMLTEIIPTSQTFHHEFRIITPSGILKWVQVIGSSRPQLDGSSLWDGVILDISDRKAVEQEIILKQNHLGALLDNIPHMAWIKDEESRFIAVNRAFAEVAGCSAAEIVGNNDYDYWPEEIAQAYRNDDAQILQSGTRKVIEEPISNPDGQLSWLETTKTPFRNADGKIAGTVGIAANITDRKEYEQKILESEAFLKTVLDTFPLSVFWKDRESRYIGFNQNFAQNAGFDHAENIAGLTDFDMPWAETEAQDYRKDDQEVIQSDSPKLGIVESQVQADGTQIWVETNKLPLHDLDGQVVGVLGTYQDISDRKRFEVALEQEVLRRTKIFDTSSDGIHIIDCDGNLLEANTNFYRMLGYTSEEDKRLNVTDWDARWTAEELKEVIQNISSDLTDIHTFETQHRRKDGSIFPVEISVCSMEWNEQLSIICIGRDISARKQAEEQLQRTNEELIRATRLKDEFLANMSHELRTPLNSILGLTEVLQEKIFAPLTEKQGKYLKIIEQSGTHLLNLINDILDVAKIESGQTELEFREINSRSLCESSIAFVKQHAISKRIPIKLNLPPTPLSLFIDERRIIQSLVNLLNNAVKFTPEGGMITLKIRYHHQGETQESVDWQSPSEQSQKQWMWESGELPVGDFITISVIDTGIGIAQEHSNTLFTPFSQIDSALNRKYSGTGLGLVLVKQIAELHGGTIRLTSQVDVGSCFSINLPYQLPPSPLESRHTPEINKLSPSDLRISKSSLILLADDNEGTISLLEPYLENFGYRLIVATNGFEAIDLAQKHHPDLILMDIQMPELDGLEAIQQIRQQPQLKTTPIIALTALAMPGDQERCLAAGANEYFSKPIKLKQLVHSIRQLLT